MGAKLEIRRCPQHKEFWAVCLEDQNECTTRLTSSKCCGRWDLVQSWPLNDDRIMDLIADLQACLDSSEAERAVTPSASEAS